MSMSSSRSYSSRHTSSSMEEEILEIEQCLFPIQEEFFLKEDSVSEEKCQSIAVSDSWDIPSLPSYTKWETLLGEGISSEIIDKLCFNETLLISTDNDKIVGGFAIQVETIADEVIAVFCSSQFTIDDGRTARSELLALTDKQFNPFQERKCETVSSVDVKQEKQLQLFFDEEQNVTAYRQEIDADKSESYHGILDAGEDGILMPDGLNVLIMRYLIITNFVGDMHTRTIDIHGRIGHSIYQITDAIPTKINSEIHDTKQVIRTVYYPGTKEPETSISYYLTNGHLLRHNWNNANYSIKINPRSSISDLSVGMDELCETMRLYLKELGKLLEESPIEMNKCYTKLAKPTEIVRLVLSEIIDEATHNTLARKRSSSEAIKDVLVEIINHGARKRSSSEVVKDVLSEIINQMSLL
ncbi:uncharacterized protein LOC131432111 [Malaya genurostris]|uniref:uncharacterized protein LOC131432111 n=1 Tax=Malaya genurostris TaxID=325434 RepID=UPI0026F3CDE2|nr:uncharacterized protein LOC131432111 [Malaya genurostris]